jgi:hypothetical protein
MKLDLYIAMLLGLGAGLVILGAVLIFISRKPGDR